MISNNFLAGSLALVLFGSIAVGGQSAMAWVCGIPERAARQKLAEMAALMAECANEKRVEERMRADPRIVMWGGDNDISCALLVADTASPELRERRERESLHRLVETNDVVIKWDGTIVQPIKPGRKTRRRR